MSIDFAPPPVGRSDGPFASFARAVLAGPRKWVVLAVVLLVLFWPFHSVPTGTRGVVTQFGRIIGIEDEGLVILPPWRSLKIFNIRAETANVDRAEGSTFDTQPVAVSLTVRYAPRVNKVNVIYEKYSHDGDLTNYVDTAVQEAFKAVTARYVATDLIAQRQKVSQDIFRALQLKLDTYDADVINIDMRSFSFSPSYMSAINEKVTQEQLRQAADNKLKTVESEQKQKVAIAEAEAGAIRARADGDAYALLKTSTAQADALRIQNAALAQNKDVLELRRIEVEHVKADKWNGVLPVNLYANAPMPFISLPATAAASAAR